MHNQRPQGSPTFKFRFRYRYPECPKPPRRRRSGGNAIASGGSIVSAFGTKNASSTNVWLTPRLIVRSEKDWSIVSARCITNVNGAETDKLGSKIFGQLTARGGRTAPRRASL